MKNGSNIPPISIQDFTNWINGILTQVFQAIQQISDPFIKILLGLGAFALILGALIGARRLRNAGFSTIIFCGIAYMLIYKAPEVIKLFQGIVQKGP